MTNNNVLPMITEKGVIKARYQVGGGGGNARYEKRRAHKADRRRNKELLDTAVEEGIDYEPELIRAEAWNVS